MAEPSASRTEKSCAIRARTFVPLDMVLCVYTQYPVWPGLVKKSHQPEHRGQYAIRRHTNEGPQLFYWIYFPDDGTSGWVRHDLVVKYHPLLATRVQSFSCCDLAPQQRQALTMASTIFGIRRREKEKDVTLPPVPPRVDCTVLASMLRYAAQFQDGDEESPTPASLLLLREASLRDDALRLATSGQTSTTLNSSISNECRRKFVDYSSLEKAERNSSVVGDIPPPPKAHKHLGITSQSMRKCTKPVVSNSNEISVDSLPSTCTIVKNVNHRKELVDSPGISPAGLGISCTEVKPETSQHGPTREEKLKKKEGKRIVYIMGVEASQKVPNIAHLTGKEEAFVRKKMVTSPVESSDFIESSRDRPPVEQIAKINVNIEQPTVHALDRTGANTTGRVIKEGLIMKKSLRCRAKYRGRCCKQIEIIQGGGRDEDQKNRRKQIISSRIPAQFAHRTVSVVNMPRQYTSGGDGTFYGGYRQNKQKTRNFGSSSPPVDLRRSARLAATIPVQYGELSSFEQRNYERRTPNVTEHTHSEMPCGEISMECLEARPDRRQEDLSPVLYSFTPPDLELDLMDNPVYDSADRSDLETDVERRSKNGIQVPKSETFPLSVHKESIQTVQNRSFYYDTSTENLNGNHTTVALETLAGSSASRRLREGASEVLMRTRTDGSVKISSRMEVSVENKMQRLPSNRISRMEVSAENEMQRLPSDHEPSLFVLPAATGSGTISEICKYSPLYYTAPSMAPLPENKSNQQPEHVVTSLPSASSRPFLGFKSVLKKYLGCIGQPEKATLTQEEMKNQCRSVTSAQISVCQEPVPYMSRPSMERSLIVNGGLVDDMELEKITGVQAQDFMHYFRGNGGKYPTRKATATFIDMASINYSKIGEAVKDGLMTPRKSIPDQVLVHGLGNLLKNGHVYAATLPEITSNSHLGMKIISERGAEDKIQPFETVHKIKETQTVRRKYGCVGTALKYDANVVKPLLWEEDGKRPTTVHHNLKYTSERIAEGNTQPIQCVNKHIEETPILRRKYGCVGITPKQSRNMVGMQPVNVPHSEVAEMGLAGSANSSLLAVTGIAAVSAYVIPVEMLPIRTDITGNNTKMDRPIVEKEFTICSEKREVGRIVQTSPMALTNALRQNATAMREKEFVRPAFNPASTRGAGQINGR